MSVTDTSPQGGTDSAQPSTDFDNPANWNYYDPDEEKQDTVKEPATKGTEGEQAESLETQEADETEEATDEQPEAPADGEEEEGGKEVSDDVLVKMPDGEALPLAELKKGYLRQSDYTRKTTDLAHRIDWVDTRAHHIASLAEAQLSFMEQTMPQRPDPALASNPQTMGQYIMQERFYEAWVQHRNAALEQAQQARGVQDEVLQNQQQNMTQEQLHAEFDRLVSVIPKMADDKFRKEFIKRSAPVFEAAGYPPDAAASITEAGHLIIVDLAMEGLAAREAKKTAKAKVANVPPVAPQKRQGASNAPAGKSREAMNKLARSGSIHDAMMVDFD